MTKEQEIAEKERQAFLWMIKKGYDRRAAKDISPILVKYQTEQLRICAVVQPSAEKVCANSCDWPDCELPGCAANFEQF